MLNIHPEVQHFVDEDKTNYETDEVNKENMNEFCIFIADQKSKNTDHKAKYDSKPCASFDERRTRRGK